MKETAITAPTVIGPCQRRFLSPKPSVLYSLAELHRQECVGHRVPDLQVPPGAHWGAATQYEASQVPTPESKSAPRGEVGGSAFPPPDAQNGVYAGRRMDSGWLSSRSRSLSPLSVWAFTATMMVLSDISTAPIQAGSTKPNGASTPAASGSAMAL